MDIILYNMKVFFLRKTKTNKDVAFVLLFSDHGASERDIVLLSMARKNIKFCPENIRKIVFILLSSTSNI